jgi:hypothetical protein
VGCARRGTSAVGERAREKYHTAKLLPNLGQL